METDRTTTAGGGSGTQRVIARPDPLDAMGGVLRQAFGSATAGLPADMQALLDRLNR